MILFVVPIMRVAIVSDPMLTGPITEGMPVTITCVVEMDALVESDLQLFTLEVTLSRDETALNLSDVAKNGTTSTYIHQIVSFNATNSGNYSCTATASPHPPSVFINASEAMSDVLRLTTGKGKK